MVIPSGVTPAPDSIHPSKKGQPNELNKKSVLEKTGKSLADQQSTLKGNKPSAFISRQAIPPPIDHSKVKGIEEIRKQVIDPKFPFFALLKMVTDPEIEKNPNKDELRALFKERYYKANHSDEKKIEILRKLLKSNQTPEIIFKNIELIIGDGKELAKIFSGLKEEYTEVFFSLIFENPTYADVLITKYENVFKDFEFPDKTVSNVFFKYCSPGTNNYKDPKVAACLKHMNNIELFKDVCCNILEADVSSEIMFKALQLIPTQLVFKYNKVVSATFTRQFVALIFENPTLALEVFDKYKKELSSFKFDHKQIEDSLRIYGAIGIDSARDRDLAECIKIMIEDLGIRSPLRGLLNTLVICDAPLTLGVLLAKEERWRDKALNKVLKWDSLSCLKRLHASGYDCNKAGKAVSNQSTKCLEYVISQYGLSHDDKDAYVKEAVQKGDIATLLILLGNDSKAVASLIFSDIEPLLKNPAPYQKKIEAELASLFNKLLRMNPIQTVDAIVTAFISQNPVAADVFPDIYEKAKKEFLKVAPFISRHTKDEQIKSIKTSYSSKMDKDQLTEELEYAKFCRETVGSLKEKLETGQLKRASTKDFGELPCSSTGTRRVAALVETIGGIRSARQALRAHKQTNKKGKDFVLCFKSLRKDNYSTDVSGRYIWASPLINAVELLSDAPDMEHNYSVKVYKDGEDKPPTPFRSYVLIYDSLILNHVAVEKTKDTELQWWYHGINNVANTWQKIEDCFEGLMAFDLKKPKDKSKASQEVYEKSLEEFYRKAAELVWLIGNTTPLERGSGTVAEWLLGIVHLQHGLEPPVLKTQFPQLDVLDITFPLSDYKDFFTYFFEPSSLPMRTKWKDMSSLSLLAQMEALYKAKKTGSLESLKEGR